MLLNQHLKASTYDPTLRRISQGPNRPKLGTGENNLAIVMMLVIFVTVVVLAILPSHWYLSGSSTKLLRNCYVTH